jgi:hypothetical protein
MLSGAGAYVPISVSASPADDDDRVRVGLEQFDLQPEGVPMLGLASGWQEPEYDPASGRTWRWISERASMWIPSVGRDVTLTLSAESPLRYFDSAPTVRISAGGETVAELSPSADFTQDVRIPARLLLAGRDEVVIESSRSFVPGNGDRRSLALRIYAIHVN